jgi:2-polyprenyl-3-methyl-5-hydroxy-6-metoxy-1,4-benzoquinol methylase
MNLNHRSCFICKEEKFKLLVGVDYLFPLYSNELIYNHKLVKCSKCGNYYINPTVSDDLLSEYYSSSTSYEIYDNESSMAKDYLNKATYQKKYIDRFLLIKNMKILDFGCATAFKLHEFKGNGNELYGFDTSDECALIAKKKYNIDVLTKFDDIKNIKFDFVILSHVLEHLIDPVSVLNFLKSIMDNDSKIYIEVPYINTFNNVDGDEIFGHITFEHVNYFNEQSLHNFMKKMGFKELSLTINKGDNATMPYYHVIQSLWEFNENKEIDFKNSTSDSFEQYLQNEKNKLGNFQQLIAEKIGDKKIIIYGTGTHTYRLLAMCPNIKENIIGFSDGNTKKYTENSFFNLPCRAIENFKDYDAILISSKASETEIYEYLKTKTTKEIIRIYE